jgi:hypothetical protein
MMKFLSQPTILALLVPEKRGDDDILDVIKSIWGLPGRNRNGYHDNH